MAKHREHHKHQTVYRHGATFWIDLIYQGRRHRKSTGFSDREKAETWAAAYRERLRNESVGIIEPKIAPTFAEFAPRFQSHIETYGKRPATVRFYCQQLSVLLNFAPLANERLDAIGGELIQRFVEHRRTQVSAPSVNRALATLNRAMHLAVEWEILPKPPKIKMLAGERSREFVLSHRTEVKYLEKCGQPLHDIAVMQLDCGLRLGEVLALQWTDIHDGFVHIKSGKSANAKRSVPLTARARLMLKARRDKVQSIYVFANPETMRPYNGQSIAHMHAKVRESLNLDADFVCHSLRHSYCTRLAEAGVGAFEIMRLAGHFSITVSQRYVHVGKKAIQSAVSQLEAHNARQQRPRLPAAKTD